MNSLKRHFEALLWNSRFIVLLAVVSSVLTGLELFILASLDSARALTSVFTALNPGMTSDVKQALLAENLTRFIAVIDGYLLGAFMLIFGFGLYELFVSDLEAAREITSSGRLLVIKSLDDLKERLGKVILLIMIVELFKDAVKLKSNEPIDLLYVGASIALIALGLYLTHAPDSEKKHQPAGATSGANNMAS
jgi:uncharacterized membrane protein YqhA